MGTTLGSCAVSLFCGGVVIFAGASTLESFAVFLLIGGVSSCIGGTILGDDISVPLVRLFQYRFLCIDAVPVAFLVLFCFMVLLGKDSAVIL